MTNKRTRKKAPRAAVAPRDVGAPPEGEEELEFASPERSESRLVRGLKLGLGGLFLLGVSAALAAGLHHYALTTPRFAVTEILVEGTRRLSRADVLGAAGISPGDNIFQLEVRSSEQSLLETPWIRSARVERRLPGQVRIEIVEREPVALVTIGGQVLLVSREGEPFKKLGSGDPHDLPFVTGLSLTELGRDPARELARLRDALRLLDEYEELPLSRVFPPEEVHLSDPGDVVLVVGGEGLSLHLGPPPFKGKLLRAVKVMEQTAKSGAKPGVVFLDNEAHPERVVVRVK